MPHSIAINAGLLQELGKITAVDCYTGGTLQVGLLTVGSFTGNVEVKVLSNEDGLVVAITTLIPY